MVDKEFVDEYSINEAVACFISRSLEDGMAAYGALGQLAVKAGVILAHLLRCPNMKVWPAMTRTNLFQFPEVTLKESTNDWRPARWAEAYRVFSYVNFEMKEFGNRYYPAGGLQIDKYGNANLFGIGDNPQRLKMRSAGSLGNPTYCSFLKFFDIFVRRHEKRVFVEKCDFITVLGYGKGGDDRRKLCIPGMGPRYLFSPLGIMDFEEESKQMRLKCLHRGVTVDKVKENTGFDMIIPQEVPIVPPPTKEELEVLRNRIDTDGLLRTNELL